MGGYAAYLLTAVGTAVLPNGIPGKFDLSVLFLLYCMASFQAMERNIHFTNDVIVKMISFVARHSFTVYLIHWNVRILANMVIPLDDDMLHYLGRLFLTIAFSFALAVIIDFILGYFKNLLRETLL